MCSIIVHILHCASSFVSLERLKVEFLATFTFEFAICCRPSVCRLSVTLVHPSQPVEIFGNVSTPFGTLAIH